MERHPMEKRGLIQGVVVSDKMEKTVVVKVDRQVRHPLYGKYIRKSRRYKAHDEKNEAKPGDLVSLVETKPISKDKRFVVQKILRKSGRAAAEAKAKAAR